MIGAFPHTIDVTRLERLTTPAHAGEKPPPDFTSESMIYQRTADEQP